MICYEKVNKKIGDVFGWYGSIVFRHPWKFIIICASVNCLLALGFLRLNVVNDAETLYTPENSQAFQDRDRIDNKFPRNGDFYRHNLAYMGQYLHVIMQPKSGEVLEASFMNEAQTVYQYVKDTLIEEKYANVSFDDISAKNNGSSVVDGEIFFQPAVKNLLLSKQIPFPDYGFTHLPYVFGKAKADNGFLVSAGAFKMRFNLRDSADVVDNWLKKIEERLKELKTNATVTFEHSHSLNDELNSNLGADITLFSITFSLMCTYASLATIKCDCLTDRSPLGMAGVLATGLAILGAFGICTLCGVPFISIVGVTPFLVVGIGVDDMFILLSGIADEVGNPKMVKDRIMEIPKKILKEGLLNQQLILIMQKATNPGDEKLIEKRVSRMMEVVTKTWYEMLLKEQVMQMIREVTEAGDEKLIQQRVSRMMEIVTKTWNKVLLKEQVEQMMREVTEPGDEKLIQQRVSRMMEIVTKTWNEVLKEQVEQMMRQVNMPGDNELIKERIYRMMEIGTKTWNEVLLKEQVVQMMRGMTSPSDKKLKERTSRMMDIVTRTWNEVLFKQQVVQMRGDGKELIRKRISRMMEIVIKILNEELLKQQVVHIIANWGEIDMIEKRVMEIATTTFNEDQLKLDVANIIREFGLLSYEESIEEYVDMIVRTFMTENGEELLKAQVDRMIRKMRMPNHNYEILKEVQQMKSVTRRTLIKQYIDVLRVILTNTSNENLLKEKVTSMIQDVTKRNKEKLLKKADKQMMREITRPNDVILEKRVVGMMRTSGMGITITSLTDLLGFLIGGSTSTFPAVRYFCIYTGVAILFCYMCHVTFFTACIALDQKRVLDKRHSKICCMAIPNEDGPPSACPQFCCSGRQPTKREDVESPLESKIQKLFAFLASSKYVKPIVIFGLLTYLILSIYGTVFFKEGLYLENLVHSDSYFHKYSVADRTYYPPEVMIMLTIETKLDYTSADVRTEVQNLLNDAKSNQYIDSNFQLSWLKFYSDSPFFTATSTQAFVDNLKLFLNDQSGRIFESDIVFGPTSADGIEASRVYVRSLPATESSDQSKSMTETRAVVTRYHTATSAYSPAFIFYEQYANISEQTILTLVIVAVCIFVVTFLFMPHPIIILLVTVAVASMMTGLIGFMHFFGLTLSSVTMIHVIMSVGFSVDYSAHICHAFMIADARKQARPSRVTPYVAPPAARTNTPEKTRGANPSNISSHETPVVSNNTSAQAGNTTSGGFIRNISYITSTAHSNNTSDHARRTIHVDVSKTSKNPTDGAPNQIANKMSTPREYKIRNAIRHVGGPVFNGAFTSFLGIVVLAASRSYIFMSFFIVMCIVITIGILHALLFLPVILSLVGPLGTNKNTETAEYKRKIAQTP